MRDGWVRWCQNTEYLQATDTKPCRNLIAIVWVARGRQALFAKALLPEIDAQLYFLRDPLSKIEDLFFNGSSPAVGTRTYTPPVPRCDSAPTFP